MNIINTPFVITLQLHDDESHLDKLSLVLSVEEESKQMEFAKLLKIGDNDIAESFNIMYTNLQQETCPIIRKIRKQPT